MKTRPRRYNRLSQHVLTVLQIISLCNWHVLLTLGVQSPPSGLIIRPHHNHELRRRELRILHLAYSELHHCSFELRIPPRSTFTEAQHRRIVRLASMAGALAPLTIPGGPRIEMIANPDFSFPMQPPSRKGSGDDVSKRPASMHINLPPAESSFTAHRRAMSTLPSFTFNASDTSGRKEGETPPQTPDETTPITPSRRGHRRGGSEFVGGDSRFGVSNAVSSSPTKTNVLPLPVASSGPPSSGRRGHAHRRSAAISSHDLGSIMQPADPQPRLSNSLPNTPLDHPANVTDPNEPTQATETNDGGSDPFGPPLEEAIARPPSRPRVEFSDNIEIIPRPLSTISSETESSISTVRGLHSQTGSINSIISLGTPSPPSSRVSRIVESLDTDEQVPTSKARSSLEASRKLENEGEGEWLKSRSSGSLKRPYSESSMAAPRTSFVLPEPVERPRTIQNKKHSLSHALGFDRRRSEPTIGMNATEPSRLSALSLQDTASTATTVSESEEEQEHGHLSSARRFKQWAKSKVSGKSKETQGGICTTGRTPIARPVSEGGITMSVPVSRIEDAVAETDLDAVFDKQVTLDQPQLAPSQQILDLNTPTPSQHSGFHARDNGDISSPMLDLDAALGPFKTPPIGPHRQRKELHSSRHMKDFAGPSGHYHRRAESAPDLPPFESSRIGTPPQHAMADVFEEDEPEDEEEEMMLPPRSDSVRSGTESESGMGVQIVDSDMDMQDALHGTGLGDGLGIMRGDWEPERPSTAYGNGNSGFFGLGSEPRATSIIEETIMEEASPGEVIEIVEAHEEPRASSLTKSSDSSDTPTIAASTGVLTLPNGQSTLMTPATYQTSAFSSPDLGRRQSSFETSRLGTSASSLADNRTVSSSHTGDHGHELRVSVDDVPSLTSSRSTMLSTSCANNSRHNVNGATRTPSASSGAADAKAAAERRRKRGSIQSLSQLVGGSFGSKSRGGDEQRPHTSAEPLAVKAPKKKEHRLKKLMFWKSKQHPKHVSQET